MPELSWAIEPEREPDFRDQKKQPMGRVKTQKGQIRDIAMPPFS